MPLHALVFAVACVFSICFLLGYVVRLKKQLCNKWEKRSNDRGHMVNELLAEKEKILKTVKELKNELESV